MVVPSMYEVFVGIFIYNGGGSGDRYAFIGFMLFLDAVLNLATTITAIVACSMLVCSCDCGVTCTRGTLLAAAAVAALSFVPMVALLIWGAVNYDDPEISQTAMAAHSSLMFGAFGILPDIVLGVLLVMTYREMDVATPGEKTPLTQ